MARCARCGESFTRTGEWVELTHHHTHMRFESDFCSVDCAVAYLEDGLPSQGD
jgi:hypothetical protein